MKRLLLLSALLLIATSTAQRCNRTPETAFTSKSRADGRYVIEVAANPMDTYVPGEQYTIFLRSQPELQHKFKEFLLVVEHEPSEKILSDIFSPAVGTLKLISDTMTKFSEKCRNSIMQTSSVPKSKVQVQWVAPPAGSGCVAIRATVVESRDRWYSDDGALSKILCEEMQESEDTQPNILRDCCACDEAKYEVTFEGLWSRNTHPKDFPSNGWLTRFSDIIGASHTVDYTFWNYGEMATKGLRLLAENGNTRQLESELKDKSEHIRTIIKARGISYPNITGKTFAVFRVDKRHHLMSLVSMIDPSPDWIVGVSSLELCLRNCSWIESRVLNLYPWDAGTDDGFTYISPNQESIPPQPIRRIKSNSPHDPRSPFFDPNGAEMKPLARLYLSRQRLYEKTCDNAPAESEYDQNNEQCEVSEWTQWTKCTATCGKGLQYKQRLLFPKTNPNCRIPILTKRKQCEVFQKSCRIPHQPDTDSHCALTDWGEWSGCSVSCGRGVKTRSRRYMNRNAAKSCAAGNENPPSLEQNMDCYEPECTNPQEETDSECTMRQWSNWSPCSSSCGKGIKTRKKLASSDFTSAYSKSFGYIFGNNQEESEENEDICSDVEERVECINDENPVCEENQNPDALACSLPKDEGGCKSNVDRWYFDFIKGSCDIFSYSGCQGNKNNFKTLERCERVCNEYKKELIANRTAQKRQLGVTVSGVLAYNMQMQNDDAERENCVTERTFPGDIETGSLINEDGVRHIEPIANDCKMSPWSLWTPCNATCGKGYKTRYRVILTHPTNGGKRCPTRILKKRKCKVRCSADESVDPGSDDPETAPDWGDPVPKIDCVMSRWSAWSPCSRTCGPHAVQQRTRSILTHPSALGEPCSSRTEQKDCKLLACPE